MARAPRGFTLVELMVTIAIAAILLMLAAPSFVRLMANTRETSATNSLVNSLDYARNTALRMAEPVTVCPTASPSDTTCSTDWNAGWSVFANPASGSTVLIAHGNLGAEGVTVSASGGGVPIVFTPRGLATGLPATGADLFTFCDSRGSAFAHSLLVNTGGYVQISQTPGQDPAGNAVDCGQ